MVQLLDYLGMKRTSSMSFSYLLRKACNRKVALHCKRLFSGLESLVVVFGILSRKLSNRTYDEHLLYAGSIFNHTGSHEGQ